MPFTIVSIWLQVRPDQVFAAHGMLVTACEACKMQVIRCDNEGILCVRVWVPTNEVNQVVAEIEDILNTRLPHRQLGITKST